MTRTIAPLILLLAACSAPPPPASVAQAAPAGASAKRAPGQEAVEPLSIFRAFGTEPFWNVNVEDATLTYSTPENPAGMVMQGERRSIDGGVEITGSHEGKAFALTVTAGTCSDGMSDNRYELVSAFRYGDAQYKGCGEAAK